MIGAVLLAHLVGDYLIQSDWMATQKVKRWWPAVVHGVSYTLPFVLLTQEPAALAVIAGTHVVIDRFRLAKYVVWLKNWVAPVRVRRGTTSRIRIESYNPPWSECNVTGYPNNRPIWLTVWLLFIADNTIHLLINVAAIAHLG